MNAGAAVADEAVRAAAGRQAEAGAPPAAYLFVHADSRPPPDAVSLVRAALARRRVVGGGFVALLESPERTWWAQSFHNGASSVLLATSSMLGRAPDAYAPFAQ